MKKPSSPSILAVDDTPANLSLLCGILKERGYRVRPVPSGELALQAAKTDPPDLVLLDISMPAMDGFEVCARLKAEPRLGDIPVIFLTAHTDVAEKVKAFSVGGVDYVTKPFQSEEIHARVATHLELCRQKRELAESYRRLSELERMRETLVHMMAHDLRSPLGAISGLLQLLALPSSGLPAQAREDVAQCLASTTKMTAMITAMLDVSKFEAAAMKLDLVPCDLLQIAREVVSDMRGLAIDRHVSIEQTSPAEPVIGDATLLARVVQNLLSNALRFTPRNGHVRIAAGSAGDGIRFSVTDDGPGVPEELRDRIFDKFVAVTPEAQKQGYSTGLGLAFCRMTIDAHGGTIGVDSAPGGTGSTFWFTLPRTRPPAP
jgi:two-component system sensor histidine kinase/response regulator